MCRINFPKQKVYGRKNKNKMNIKNGINSSRVKNKKIIFFSKKKCKGNKKPIGIKLDLTSIHAPPKKTKRTSRHIK